MTTLAQSLGIALAAGISPYVTVFILGLASQLGWIGPLPGALEPVTSPWIMGLAGALSLVEFLATLIPGVATVWESIHTAIRPPAAALFAVLTVWNGEPALLLAAALLGGGLGLVTHGTKLGLRAAIDTSPEPFTNGSANVAEWATIAALAIWVWHNPFLALGLGLAGLLLLILLVRAVWKSLRRLASGFTRPAPSEPTAG